MSSAKSRQHKKQELRVNRLQDEHRKTYLFLGISTQNPEQEKTEQDNMNEGEKSHISKTKKDERN